MPKEGTTGCDHEAARPAEAHAAARDEQDAPSDWVRPAEEERVPKCGASASARSMGGSSQRARLEARGAWHTGNAMGARNGMQREEDASARGTGLGQGDDEKAKADSEMAAATEATEDEAGAPAPAALIESLLATGEIKRGQSGARSRVCSSRLGPTGTLRSSPK
jgi:hypothetical protein